MHGVVMRLGRGRVEGVVDAWGRHEVGGGRVEGVVDAWGRHEVGVGGGREDSLRLGHFSGDPFIGGDIPTEATAT